MSAHSFPDNPEPSRRCVYCGTTFEHNERTAQPCVPHGGSSTEKLYPEPKRRTLACEDGDAIATRMAELRKEHDEAMNHKADE